MTNEPNGKEVDTSKAFHIQLKNAHILLTYKTHINKEEFTKFIDLKEKVCKAYIAHENADTLNPYEHSHVLLLYKVFLEVRTPRYWDYEGIHPNIRKIVTNAHKLNIYNYMFKEDKSLLIPMMELLAQGGLSCFQKVEDCKTKMDVLKLAQRPSEVSGYILLWNNMSKKKDKPIHQISKKWQIDLERYLKGPASIRHILWYYDFIGNTGKSEFCKYMMLTHGSLVFTQFGGSKDAATIIKGALENGWDQRVVLIDLPRSAKQHKIYSSIEMIKNGLVTTLKYYGSTEEFEIPHVVVFANFEPDRFNMSQDRWVVRELPKGQGESRRSSDPLVGEVNTPSSPLKAIITPPKGGLTLSSPPKIPRSCKVPGITDKDWNEDKLGCAERMIRLASLSSP